MSNNINTTTAPLNPVELAYAAGKLAATDMPLSLALLATAAKMMADAIVKTEIEFEHDVIAYLNEDGQVTVLKVGICRDENGEVIFEKPDPSGNVYARSKKTYTAYRSTRTSKAGKVSNSIMFKAMHGAPNVQTENTSTPDSTPPKPKKGTDL